MFTVTRETRERELPAAAVPAGRRLALLKRFGFFGELPGGCRIVRACTLDDYQEAYQLVYRAFLDRGYILPNPTGMRIRIFEATTDMRTFVAKCGARIVGVQSLVRDAAEVGLPSDMAFHAELDSLRTGGAIVYEGTNQAVVPEFRRTAVPTALMRAALAHAYTGDCDELITTVSPGHASFYELLGFRRVSPVRSYSSTVADPVLVMVMNLPRLRQDVPAPESEAAFIHDYAFACNPLNAFQAGWDYLAARSFRDPALLRELFVRRSRLLQLCTESELDFLCHRWGERLFAAVHHVELPPGPSVRVAA